MASWSRDPDCPALTINVASPSDVARVDELLTASYARLLKAAYDDDLLARALPMMTVAKPDLLASGRFYLAECSNGALLGCGGWSESAPGGAALPAGTAHLRHFATHPDHLGKGVGRLIYRHCARTASSAGITIFLVHASLNAEPFYARLGLAKVSRLDIALSPGLTFPVVEMAGPIASE